MVVQVQCAIEAFKQRTGPTSGPVVVFKAVASEEEVEDGQVLRVFVADMLTEQWMDQSQADALLTKTADLGQVANEFGFDPKDRARDRAVAKPARLQLASCAPEATSSLPALASALFLDPFGSPAAALERDRLLDVNLVAARGLLRLANGLTKDLPGLTRALVCFQRAQNWLTVALFSYVIRV
jgi:hypothetical protein